jgi:hypothetical protein
MKKIVFGVIATVVLGFAGNAQTKEVEPALSTEYYNYVFDLSEISESAHVLNVSNLTDEEYTSYGKLISDVNFNLQKFTFKMEVQKDDVKKTIIVIPLLDGKTSLAFVEDNINDDLSIIQIKFTDDGKYTTSQYRGTRTKAQCKDEAGDLQNLAGGIASLGLIGCAPCAFAGGATLGIISFMAYFC